MTDPAIDLSAQGDLPRQDGKEHYEFIADAYQTPEMRPSLFVRSFPTMVFYGKFCLNVLRSCHQAKRGTYDSRRWSESSREVADALESVGVRMEITGAEKLRDFRSPCVFVGNHMSMLETLVLPSIIQPVCDVTFVVKQSLLEYPLFRHIVGTRDPIGVSRENPREDFKVVMTEGRARLQQGRSVIVFPQTTRASTFDPDQFNSIGVKLAARAKVPVVPIALKTDAWGNGRLIKDLGPIDPGKRVHFAIGEPMDVEGRGDAQQKQCVEFIQQQLTSWAD